MGKGIIVVKVGTSTLSDGSGRLDVAYIDGLASQICQLLRLGYKVILVSSGAIGAGIEALGLSSRPKELLRLQACAAIGQGRLMKAYEDSFSKRGIHAAQVLLTQEDFASRKRFINAKHTIMSLIDEFNSVPVINENDTIATEEIKFGDNDRLSSLVAGLIGAHTLIILTDVDGLYSSKDRRVVPLVTSASIGVYEKMTRPSKGKLGTGGILTKLQAARTVVQSGITCIIANGRAKDILLRIVNKESVGTTFLPAGTKAKAKKSWLTFSPTPKGAITVDEGAKRALTDGKKSLLAAGIKGISGRFLKGDVVSIRGWGEEEFARGMVNFSSEELAKIKGLKTSQIEGILNRKVGSNEVVHRDNLVILTRLD